jgi:acyl-coenzyme A synthetase/AMP-(fatty) acid ligase
MRHWFLEKITKYEASPAVIFAEKVYSYGDLVQEVDRVKELLQQEAVHSGEVVALISDYSFNAVALFLALMENKNVIVPITSKTEGEIGERLEESYSDKKITVNQNYHVTPLKEKEKHSLIKGLQEKDHAGLILFSSGSTGKPKAIVEDLDKLVHIYRRGHGAFRTMVFLMFDHIGGVNTLFHILTSGGCAVFPLSRDPAHVCALIEKHSIQVLPTSPTFLNLIMISGAYEQYNISSLKLITYGTESMPESLLKRLKKAFPRARLKQTFGTSETGILSTKSKADDSLFMKLGGKGFAYKVIEGQLFIKSDVSMVGYLNADDPFTDEGWFPTGDLVEVDKDGYLKIKGRTKEVINVGGEKVLPAEIESLLLTMPQLEDVMAYGEKNAITGESVTVDVVLKEGIEKKNIKKQIRKFCLERLDRFKIPTKVNVVEQTNFGERFKKIRHR